MLLIAVEVRASAIHGLGVFAGEAVAKGQTVWQFDPGMDRKHPAEWLQRQPAHVRRFMALYGVLSLDRRHYYIAGDQTLYINHSAAPNLVPRPEILVNDEEVVVAARDIAVGAELTIDYGTIDGADRDRLAQGGSLF
jgi:hypothetical protein